MSKIRICNIGFQYKDKSFGSFVKYYRNEDYNRLEDHLSDGWVDKGTHIKKNNWSKDKSIFAVEEFNLVIGNLEYISSECCTELRTNGSRILDLSHKDREDFFEVYRIVDQKMYKENETEN